MRAEDKEFFDPSQLDFVPRERRRHVLKLIAAFAVIVGLVFMFGYGPNFLESGRGPVYSMVAVSLLCFYVVLLYQRVLDLLMATEYQNLLFSQGLAIGGAFVMIVRDDGTIVYANEGLISLFPWWKHADIHALEAVLEQGGVTKTDRDRLMDAIYNNKAERLVFPIKTPAGVAKDFILSVKPMIRPARYTLIRGREFVLERAGAQTMPVILRSTSTDKLSNLLETTPIAHYTTDAFGRFEYATPSLEQNLGYPAGALVAERITLKSVLRQLDNQLVLEDYVPTEFSGNAIVQRKDGAHITCLVFQRLIRDTSGKVTGASGSIVTSTMIEQ